MHGDNALGTYTTGPGCSHDKVVCATKDFCRNMDSMSRQTCLVAKKKKLLPGIEASQLGIRAWGCKYLGLDGQGSRSCIVVCCVFCA